MKTSDKEKNHQVPATQGSREMVTLDDEEIGGTGRGLENIRQEEMGRSFLYLLQQSSKAATRGSAKYVTGAQAGMFFSTGTQRVYDEVEFVPVDRNLKYLEWVPLDDGGEGGFRGEYSPDDEFVTSRQTKENQFSSITVSENGTELVQTFEIYALVGEPGFTLAEAEFVTIPITSIKIKHYTNWLKLPLGVGAFYAKQMNRHEPVTLDLWRHRYRLSAEFEEQWKPNGAWNIRINWAVSDATPQHSLLSKSDPLCVEAEKIYNLIRSGAVKSDYAAAEREPGDDADDIPL